MRATKIAIVLAVVVLVATVGCISSGNPAAGNVDAEAHLVAGYEANGRGDWVTAIDEYTRAIELETTARGYVGRAYAHGNLGEVDAAIADLTAAIELDDEVAAAFNQRALYYNQQERWAEAVADLDRAIELRPGQGDQYNGRALAHLNLGHFELAVEDASRAIELDPDGVGRSVYYGNRASAYQELGELQRALEDFAESVRLDPNNSRSRFGEALVLVELGDGQEALDRLTEATLAVDDPISIVFMKVEVLGRIGRMDEAVTEVDAALGFLPTYAPLYALRGFLHAELGETEQAKLDYERALELSDDPLFSAEVQADLDRLDAGEG